MKCGRPCPHTPAQPFSLHGPRAAEAASTAGPEAWLPLHEASPLESCGHSQGDSSSLPGMWQLSQASLFTAVTLVSCPSLCSHQRLQTPLQARVTSSLGGASPVPSVICLTTWSQAPQSPAHPLGWTPGPGRPERAPRAERTLSSLVLVWRPDSHKSPGLTLGAQGPRQQLWSGVRPWCGEESPRSEGEVPYVCPAVTRAPGPLSL